MIKDVLADCGTSWETFERMILFAVDRDEEEGGYGRPLFQDWHSWGTDEQVTGDIRDLIESMALLTNRVLEWKEPEVPMHVPKVHSAKTCWQRMGFGMRMPAGQEAACGCYICFDKIECASAARILQLELQQLTEKPVLLGGWHGAATRAYEEEDASDEQVAEQVDHVLDQLAHVELGVVLLLSESVLKSPLTLMELHEAFKLRLPVVPIVLKSHGYDFDRGHELLRELSKQLPKLLDEQKPGSSRVALRMLAHRGMSLSSLSKVLARHVPNLIAIRMDVSGSDNKLNSTCQDAIRRFKKGQKAAMAMNHPTNYPVGTRVRHEKHGPGMVTQLLYDGRTRILFDSGINHRYKAASVMKLTVISSKEEVQRRFRRARGAIAVGNGHLAQCSEVISAIRLQPSVPNLQQI
jgi:hypothetical protein